MNDLMNLRIGHGHDIHALVEGYDLWLGGALIPNATKGFATHSDGDVLSHALVDALAGAIADGDLGTHFPENDPDAEDARSLNFVERFGRYVRSKGYQIVNVDSFVTLGTTRLRPHVGTMRANFSTVLQIPQDRVSVKARSHDDIGEVGRGDACSATATVLLLKSDSAHVF